MALTKSTIVEAIQNQTGMTKNKAAEAVDSILEIIKKTLASGDDVLISGFGKFQIKEKGERRGRNPATGGDLILRPRRVVTFKVSGKLRKRVNVQVLRPLLALRLPHLVKGPPASGVRSRWCASPHRHVLTKDGWSPARGPSIRRPNRFDLRCITSDSVSALHRR